MNKIYLLGLIVLMNIISVFGDVFVKKAALQKKFDGISLLLIGALIYSLTALGWFYIFRGMKLSSAGAISALFVVLTTVTAGIFYFNEKLQPLEFLGIGLALISIVLLYRFA